MTNPQLGIFPSLMGMPGLKSQLYSPFWLPTNMHPRRQRPQPKWEIWMEFPALDTSWHSSDGAFVAWGGSSPKKSEVDKWIICVKRTHTMLEMKPAAATHSYQFTRKDTKINLACALIEKNWWFIDKAVASTRHFNCLCLHNSPNAFYFFSI